jgi:hypothetical protein
MDIRATIEDNIVKCFNIVNQDDDDDDNGTHLELSDAYTYQLQTSKMSQKRRGRHLGASTTCPLDGFGS